MFASGKKHWSKYSCASLMPLGMKWACVCAGDGEVFRSRPVSVLCVFVRVGMSDVVAKLVVSVLAFLRWLLYGVNKNAMSTL